VATEDAFYLLNAMGITTGFHLDALVDAGLSHGDRLVSLGSSGMACT
jgi:hypothetical protein